MSVTNRQEGMISSLQPASSVKKRKYYDFTSVYGDVGVTIRAIEIERERERERERARDIKREREYQRANSKHVQVNDGACNMRIQLS